MTLQCPDPVSSLASLRESCLRRSSVSVTRQTSLAFRSHNDTCNRGNANVHGHSSTPCSVGGERRGAGGGAGGRGGERVPKRQSPLSTVTVPRDKTEIKLGAVSLGHSDTKIKPFG